MPNPIVGGSIIMGGASLYGADKAADSAEASQKRALAFEQKKYDDWKALYGDVEENLADYYKNLTPEYYEVRGVEAFEKEKEATLTKLRETFEQRGIRRDSSLALGTEAAFEMGAAATKANIRASAEQATADAKQSFLGLGTQREPAGIGPLLLQDANNQAAMARQAAEAAGEAFGTAVTTTATGLSDYFKAKKGP